jgi:hypothetical protein
MFKKMLIVVVPALLVLAGTANALKIRAGDLILNVDGGFAPTALPKYRDAPIVLYGHGRLSTVSGELPPIVETVEAEFDRHGSVQTTGLPVCHPGELEATTVAQARHNCGGAIVGKGVGSAIIDFPEQKPFKISSPITGFNGPKKNGQPTVLAHAYIDVPVPTTFVVPIVIERINKGVYGYRVKARIPKIAGGAGHGISISGKVGRKWTYKGRRYSFVNARCETGHLQARGEATFDDGTVLSGILVKPCTVRRG